MSDVDWHVASCRGALDGEPCACPPGFNAYKKEALRRHGFVTKDSGQREEFESGARRDTQDGKPRYDLVPAAPLKRLAELMARGAVKYGDSNWMKGMPASRFLASMMRHVEAYRLGERDEDHLAAVVFNAFAIMHFEGTDWDDIDWS